MPTIDFKDIGEILKHHFLQGTIVTIDPATDTCTVDVDGSIVSAILFFHCTGAEAIRENGAVASAATEFVVGDQVFVVLGKNAQDEDIIRVISPLIKRKCVPLPIDDYYIFYLDGTLKIANCSWESGLIVVDTKNGIDLGVTNPTGSPIKFSLKRFTHNVPVNGVPTVRDLYFIVTSLQLAGQYAGWTNFATANPAFPLVTNNANTKITMTAQVLTDLNNVNYAVNHAHAYISDYPSDNWRIMGSGESGDCEDFALTKAQELLALGYPASALHIEVGVINATLAHAWLVVQTSTGDYALDRSSDTAIINSSLMPDIGGTYYSRHRQIGSKWASISPFAWMDGAVNTDHLRCYVLDPLLNILHYMVTIEPGFKFFDWPSNYQISVNFSSDFNSIYLYASSGVVYQFKLNENKLDLIGTTSTSSFGYVNRDGSIHPQPYLPPPVPPPSFVAVDCEVVSPDGYYNYIDATSIGTNMIIYSVVINTNPGNPFVSDGTYGTSPFGEVQLITGGLSFWGHIQASDVLIQSFMWNSPNEKRMYKNGASCLDAVTAAVGATEANLFGLAYIPSTNRLN